MTKISFLFYSALFFFAISVQIYTQPKVVWSFDKPDSVGSFIILPLTSDCKTDFPKLFDTELGKSFYFDGVNDGFLIKNNPLDNASSFTIEIIIKPDSADKINNKEQRYFHLRNLENDNCRILIELRYLNNNRWALDTFLKSENSRLTLYDSTITHEIGKWYHVALVYEKGIMSHFVNGKQELSCNIEFDMNQINNGQISIGARMDPRSWFKGFIHSIIFSHQALLPNNFSHSKIIN
jgi:hypothetical protein